MSPSDEVRRTRQCLCIQDLLELGTLNTMYNALNVAMVGVVETGALLLF